MFTYGFQMKKAAKEWNNIKEKFKQSAMYLSKVFKIQDFIYHVHNNYIH